jgi:hypothetical protein
MSDITFEKDFSRHPLHYFTLLVVQLIGLWGIFWFSYQQYMQFVIVVSMAVSYVVWGIIHHQEHKDLHPKIVAEYVLIAMLVVIVFGSLLFNT